MLRLNYDAIMRHLRTNKDDFNRLDSEHFSQLFDLFRIFSKKEDFESFLSDIKIKFNANTIKSFSLLVSHFGFGSIKRSLKAFFNVSALNFTKICRFIQVRLFIYVLLFIMSNSMILYSFWTMK